MQLKSLYIKDYKLFENFKIDFPYDFKKYISILIGTNGSGKSTILEVIAQIFSDVYLNKEAKFTFELEYSIRLCKLQKNPILDEQHVMYILVKLYAKNGEEIQVHIDSGDDSVDYSKKITKNTHKIILNQGNEKIEVSYLPDNIIIYYSGLSEIMKNLVFPHNEKLAEAYRKNNTLIDRKFFYFKPKHFGIILTSLLSYEYGEIPSFLAKKAKIKGVESIKIVLQKPEWAKDSIQNFWGAKGEVRNFLDYLNENSATLEGLTNPDSSKGIGNLFIEAWQEETFIITILTQEKLFEIREHLVEERKLFEVLNMLLIDGMLKDISFSLIKTNEEYSTFKTLSEGEQQIIITKGLTELLSDKNSLFLFDEPDTYLHPKWQTDFISEIEENREDYNSENTFLIATHSPQILSNANKAYCSVNILEEGKLYENTHFYYGRKINSILNNLMGVKERNKLVSDKLSKLFKFIEDEDIEKAEVALKKLQDFIGEDDSELKRAELEIMYLKEDEKDN